MHSKIVLTVAFFMFYIVFSAGIDISKFPPNVTGTNCNPKHKSCEKFCIVKYCDHHGNWNCIETFEDLTFFRINLGRYDLEDIVDLNCFIQSRDEVKNPWQCIGSEKLFKELAFQNLTDIVRFRVRENTGTPKPVSCDASNSTLVSDCRMKVCDEVAVVWRCLIPTMELTREQKITLANEKRLANKQAN